MATMPITKKYTNVSTEDVFQFVFHCDRCGAGIESERYKFNAESFESPPESHAHAHALLWTLQHEEAYERANSEARFDFNLCPVCGRRVCNHCFHVTQDAATDMCTDCRQAREKPDARKLFNFRQSGKEFETTNVSFSHKGI